MIKKGKDKLSLMRETSPLITNKPKRRFYLPSYKRFQLHISLFDMK